MKTKEVIKEYLQAHGKPDASTLQPVIFFPGLGGSSLEAEIDKNYKPAWECFQKWGWWGIWINLYEALVQTCWFDNLQATYNETTQQFNNQPGVKIRPKDFGGLEGVDKLDHFDDPFGLTDYFMPIIDALAGIGYEGGKTMFGAPYDWRLSTDDLMTSDIVGNNYTWEENVVMLVEKAFEVSGQKSHLLSHSMGGPTVLYFLNRRTLEWKEKYVASFIPIAGPFTGAFKSLKSMISGDNLGFYIPLIDYSLLSLADITRNFRTSGGGAVLVPDASFYPEDQVFVSTKNPPKNYTASEFAQMFLDMKDPLTSKIVDKTKDLISNLVHPQTPSYCLYGYGLPTEIAATYDSLPDAIDQVNSHQPTFVDYSNLGDGTVPLFSLIECKNWIDREHTTHKVNCKEYNVTSHTQILKDEELIYDLLEIVTDKTNITGCDDLDTPMYVEAVKEMKARGKKK